MTKTILRSEHFSKAFDKNPQKSKYLAGGDMHGFARKIRKIEELPKMNNF